MRWQKIAELLDGINQWAEKILASFHYSSWAKLGESLAPSLKYANMTNITVVLSAIGVSIIRVFGLDSFAFLALLLVFAFELVTGVRRANSVKEELTSAKFSRFSFKVTYYLLMIGVSYTMSESFLARGKEAASIVFDWMHLFFVVQIVLENIVSISENIAVVEGKEKSHYIQKLQDKVNKLFS